MQSFYLSRGKRRFVAVSNVNMKVSIILLYISVYLTILLSRTSALLPSYYYPEASICRKPTEIIKTKLVPYEETYLFLNLNIFPQIRKRINYKVDYNSLFKYQEVCCKGYKEILKRCVPICSPECVSGTCKAPDLCECSLGYEKTSMNVCKPVCSNSCLNGECVLPEVCQCFPNYWLDSDGYTCHPVCDKDCESNNAYCSVSNTCVCNNGYKKSNESDTCEPICENECINGKCIKPNVCGCGDGYVLHTSGRVTCVSNCDQKFQSRHPHVNGTCTESNTYKCDITAATCRPLCTPPCGPNGECIAPNSCLCNEGYHNMTTTDYKYVCQPFCELDCEHGNCTHPNVCTCHMGYELDESGRCVPVCDPSCTNGTCIEPYVCSCDEGFILRNETICEPFCEDSCINGTCIAPNICQCNENFVETKNNDSSVCVPACTRNCSGHGTCVNELNTCLCFYGWTGQDCDEINVCVYKMTIDSPLLSLVTFISLSNSTLMESYNNAPLCYQCSDSVNNETLCFSVESDVSVTMPTLGCFFSTELPCYRRPQHDAFKKSTRVTVSLIGVTIAIIAIMTVIGYVIIQKRRKQQTMSVNVQAVSLNTADMEALIVEQGVFTIERDEDKR